MNHIRFKILLLVFSFILIKGLSINCSSGEAKKEQTERIIKSFQKRNEEQKSIAEVRKHFKDINETLFSVGLIQALCSIIGEYVSSCYHVYYQFDRTNGGHTSLMTGLAYSYDNKFLFSCSYDRTIKIWDMDLESGNYLKCISTLINGYLNTLVYLPNNKCLASGGYNLRIWNMDCNSDKYLNCIACLDSTNGSLNNIINTLVYLSEDKFLASGHENGAIKIWDLNLKSEKYLKLIAKNDGHVQSLKVLVYLAENKCLAAGYVDATIKIWKIDSHNKDLKCFATFDKTNDGHAHYLSALAYLSNSKCLASSGYFTSKGKGIKIWDMNFKSDKYLKCIASFDGENGGHKVDTDALLYLPDAGSKLISAGYDCIKIWDMDPNSKTYMQCINTFGENQNLFTNSLTYCPNINCLVSGSSGGYGIIKLWFNTKDILGNSKFLPIDNKNQEKRIVEEIITEAKPKSSGNNNSFCVIA